MDFGILTLATPSDYKKAIGLALSAKVSNPGVPLAVACSPKLAAILKPHFDFVVAEDPSLRGFVHKVHLDKYSPFENTFFFDSDVLLFRDLKPIAMKWANQPYTACGKFMREGHSAFGLNRARVLQKIGAKELVVIDGAGHAYFRKPECVAVFDLARDITNRHQEYCGDIKYADEDVMDIAMTMLRLNPEPEGDFFSRYASGRSGTISMDATQGACTFVGTKTGEVTAPHMMHFAANEAAFQYAWQLHRLFKAADLKSSGLLKDAVNDYYTRNVAWPLKARIKRLLA
ncbi:MAG: hypothetical protein ABIY86_07075 [Rhodoferax sp.]